MSETAAFRPARPPGLVIWAARILNRLDLAWRNRLRLEPRDLEVLRDLPPGMEDLTPTGLAPGTRG